MIVYRVEDDGAVIVRPDGEIMALLPPGTLLCGERIEAIDPTEAEPIQARMRDLLGPMWVIKG